MLDKQQILQTLGFDSFTSMQEEMAKAGSSRGGIVLLSPTGSGKTLGYLLPAVDRIDVGLDTLQVVVVTPTRELAQQSEEVLKSMKIGIRSLALYGGRPAMEEHRKIKEVKPQIVFATPGRLNDHLNKENLNARGVSVLIIDEFDKCLELGFQDEMNDLLNHFSNLYGCWLMSATDAEEIPQFMNRLFKTYHKIDYLSIAETQTESRLQVRLVRSEKKDKLESLARLLTLIKGEPTIVFVSYRESVERVGKWLREQGFTVEMYHGGMEQEWRERALYKFRSGAANVLVSTDLAARGLDIPEVRAIVHYHLPMKEEESIANVMQICPIQPRYATIYIGRGKRDKLSKGDVLGFLCKKGGLRADEIGRIDIGSHYAYVSVLRKQLRTVLRQVSGEKIKGMKTLIEEMRR